MARFPRFGVKIPKDQPVKGKSARQEFLPSRHALNKLTGGSPADRTFSMYAKRTPVGMGAPDTYGDIEQMGEKGIDVKGG